MTTRYQEVVAEEYEGEYPPKYWRFKRKFTGDRTRYAVILSSRENPPRIESFHSTLSAAIKAVRRYEANFGYHYPRGYGYAWYPARRVE